MSQIAILCNYCGEIASIESSMQGKAFCSQLCENQYWREDYDDLLKFAAKSMHDENKRDSEY